MFKSGSLRSDASVHANTLPPIICCFSILLCPKFSLYKTIIEYTGTLRATVPKHTARGMSNLSRVIASVTVAHASNTAIGASLRPNFPAKLARSSVFHIVVEAFTNERAKKKRRRQSADPSTYSSARSRASGFHFDASTC